MLQSDCQCFGSLVVQSVCAGDFIWSKIASAHGDHHARMPKICVCRVWIHVVHITVFFIVSTDKTSSSIVSKQNLYQFCFNLALCTTSGHYLVFHHPPTLHQPTPISVSVYSTVMTIVALFLESHVVGHL